MIFSFYQPIDYAGKLTTNIFKDYRAYFNRAAVGFQIRTYFIQGSPTPEQLAYKLYNNTQLYWVLLMLNNNYDPFYGWISSQESGYAAAEQRYSKIGGQQVLYHVDEQGEKYYNLVEDPNNPQHWYDKGDKFFRHIQYNGPLAAVDTMEDAVLKIEQKREIKIIDPKDIDRFVSAMIDEMERE